MTETIHNLDEGVQEYFEFSVKGHVYRFRHLNTEEVHELMKLSGEELEKHIYQFITKVNPESPDFTEISKKMITPEWANFKKMITSEFGA